MSQMETEFKDKSKSIRIDPSPATWYNLHQQLAQKRKRRITVLNFRWAIAAGITGILFIASLLFIKTNPPGSSSPTMAFTVQFEEWTGTPDIYYQIAELNQAYSRLHMSLPSQKKEL